MFVLLGLLSYPIFATMLLLVAGILIGYAVCYPFRADTSGVSEQLEQMQQQNATLQNALDDQRSAYARLEHKHHEQQYEWAQVRDSQLDLTTAWNKFGQSYSKVAAEIKQLRQTSEEATELVQHERVERKVAEEALLAAEDKVAELSQQISNLEASDENPKKLKSRLEDAHRQIEQPECSNQSRLVGQVRRSQRTYAATEGFADSFGSAADRGSTVRRSACQSKPGTQNGARRDPKAAQRKRRASQLD